MIRIDLLIPFCLVAKFVFVYIYDHSVRCSRARIPADQWLYCVSNSLFRNDPAIVEIFEYLRVLGVNWDESFRLRSLDEVFNLIIA